MLKICCKRFTTIKTWARKCFSFLEIVIDALENVSTITSIFGHVDVRYVDETEGLRMIVDSGAPMLIVSAGWLEKDLRNGSQ